MLHQEPIPPKDIFLNKFWVKILSEIVISIFLWFVFQVLSKLLPKKWRINRNSIAEMIADFNVLFANLVDPSDNYGKIFMKSNTLLNRLHNRISEYKQETPDSFLDEFKTFIENNKESKDYDITKESLFIQYIFCKLKPISFQKVGKLFTSKIGQNVYRTEYETDENKTVVLFLVESDETTYLSTEKCESNISLLSQKKAISSLRFEYILAKPKDFNCNGLINVLFKEYGNELFLQADNDQELIFSKLETNIDNYIRDAKLENLLLEEISKFRGRNIQRSYLLYGPPGVGKTIFCSNLAKKISGRILKIDSSVMENLNDESFKNIVRSLKYDFLIIDDIDRIEVRNTPIFLFVLESMKNFPHKPTLLATCNHINSLDKAVLRPGRFDDIMEFNLPDEKERFEFLRKLLLAYGIELSEKEIKEFSSLTANMTQAYLREYVNQLAIENSFDVVKEKIVKRSKYLNMEEDYHAFNSQNR